MGFKEIYYLFDGFFLLLGITVLLLQIFIMRFKKNRDLLAISGVIGSPILILAICWIIWGRYSLTQATLNAVTQHDPAVSIVTFDKHVLKEPVIFKHKNVRYIIDNAAAEKKYYLPWRLLPVRSNSM